MQSIVGSVFQAEATALAKARRRENAVKMQGEMRIKPQVKIESRGSIHLFLAVPLSQENFPL